MSGQQEETRPRANGQDDDEGAPETRARLNGWRPQSEWKGDPDKWVPADEFLNRGHESPAVLRNRNNVLADRFDSYQRTTTENIRGLQGELAESKDMLVRLTEMNRSAELRAYERARRELKTEQTQAVEAGDTARFRALDVELTELDKTKPAEVASPARRQPTANPPNGTAPAGNGTPPEVREYYRRNPWYDATRTRDDRDEQRMDFADNIFNASRANHPDWPIGDHIDYVDRETRARFPDRFRARSAAREEEPEPDDEGGAQQEDRAGRRREQSTTVARSSEEPPRRPRAGRHTFESMPEDSKDAYEKYAKMLKGKGEPLSKDEWATTYWAQEGV